MIGRAGNIPYLYTGLVPILEWNREFIMYMRVRGGRGEIRTSPIAKYFPSAERHMDDIGFLWRA